VQDRSWRHHIRRLTSGPGGGRRRGNRDSGAAAVEFALLLPLLMLFLFGIIQYGYGLFELQAFKSTMADASRLAATGIESCPAFDTVMNTLADNNGLDPGLVTNIHVQWLNSDGADRAERLGLAKITASYTPFKIGVPFIPFPSQFTQSQTVLVSDIGDSAVTGC
jgi:TadE-like protein